MGSFANGNAGDLSVAKKFGCLLKMHGGSGDESGDGAIG